MATTKPDVARIDLPVGGMDCAACTRHVEEAVRKLPGVRDVSVLLSVERATVAYDPALVTPGQIKQAIGEAGYTVREAAAAETLAAGQRDLTTVIGWGVLGTVAAVVLVAVVGEQLGVFDALVERLPWWLMALAIAIGGWPVFRGVLAAARVREVTSHTLMTLGVLAAIAVGEWPTAALIVFFMRFGDWVEGLTTERSRQALRELVALRPATARVLRPGSGGGLLATLVEVDVPVEQVAVGEVVVVRPGERIPVDGRIVAGQAPVDQASITGESVPIDKEVGDRVFAATICQAGFLKVEATAPASDTTFARIVRLVEEAEARKAPVQRFADRFAGYYIPVVLGIAIVTLLVTGRVLNAVAVVVVSCACAIVLATPVVVLASVGTAARRGLLIKGGAALEQLARVDTLVVDKTGTLTLGTPTVTDVVTLNGLAEPELLGAVAAVEARSEHPLAKAIARAAAERGLRLAEPDAFTPLPGRGVVGAVGGRTWAIGNRRLLGERGIGVGEAAESRAGALEAAGKTVFFAADGTGVAGLIAVADPIRPAARDALAELRRLGVRRMLLLTGDDERVATAVASELGRARGVDDDGISIEHRANLLPEEKIEAVRALQAGGAVVMMVGDGVNDAPALAQADVGVAMGVAGSAVAIEAADVALLRDDWAMVPEAVRLGRRAARTIRQNLGFTGAYNVVGISLAALGILPPVWAAAAQSLPDVAIMLNSSRLLRPGTQRRSGEQALAWSEATAEATADSRAGG